ncbi:MAG: hypothetical protein Q7S84_01415 [bacterium]|nr:hypothetical protein [bacterium]
MSRFFFPFSFFLRRFLPALGIAAAVFSLVYGVYLPFRKSSAYINAIRNLQTAKSLTEVIAGYDRAFKIPSPVGGEELAKFASYDVLNMISNPRQPEEVSRELVRYIEQYAFHNNVRHLLAIAQLHATLWQRFQKDEDYVTAERYYRDAYAIGPKLPPVLFGLLNLYGAHGDTAKAEEIGNEIVRYWPTATDVGNALLKAREAPSSATTTL